MPDLTTAARKVTAIALVALAIASVSGCTFIDGFTRGYSKQFEAAKQEYKAGKYEAAEKDLSVVIKKNQRHVDARKMMGLVLVAQGDNEGAIKQYAEAVKIDPKDDDAFNSMGLLEGQLGRSKEASRHIRQALVLKPNNRVYADELARLSMSQGQFKEAALLWGSLLTNSAVPASEHKSILLLQAQAYQQAQDYKQAKKALRAALALDPKDKAVKKRLASFK